MRVAVLHPQTAFVRGGAETHTEALVRALRDAATRPTSCRSPASGTRRASSPTRWRFGAASTSGEQRPEGRRGDRTEVPRLPAQHERKIVWLIHQHRTAYELWDHPDYADLKRQDDGAKVRDMVWEADRVALGEAKRVFTNAKNVRDRLWSTLRIPAEPSTTPAT